MKNHFKYSILIALFLIATMTISAVFAFQIPIGTAKQVQPFESQPTINAKTPVSTYWSVGTPTSAYDGDDLTSTILKVTSTLLTGTTAVITFSGFTVPTPPEAFTADWVDLKVMYEVPTQTGDDTYKIDYSTDGTTWIPMVPAVSWASGAFAKAVRPKSQIATSGAVAWDWTQVSNLRVRITITKVGTAWDTARTFVLYEIWATVYPFPLPPANSPALSVMPSLVYGVPENPTANVFFVDVYAQGLTAMGAGLWGYQVAIKYDTTMVTALSWFTYWPFLMANPSAIDDTVGYVSVSYATFLGDTVGFTGDSTPLCRIYFQIDPGAGGKTSVLDLLDQRPQFITELKPVGLPAFVPPLYDSAISSPAYLSFVGGIFTGTDPTGTAWTEDYPTFGRTWNVVAWTDNGDGVLSVSDQIRLNVGGVTKDYHVDQMTITIHWTFKEGGGEGAAEPLDPATTVPIADPTGTMWHQIHPVYSRTFAISGWTDNGDLTFSASDQFSFAYDDDPLTILNAHLDSITTNILVSEKPGPSIPEFPLGLAFVLAAAPLIPLVHVWRTKRRVMKK